MSKVNPKMVKVIKIVHFDCSSNRIFRIDCMCTFPCYITINYILGKIVLELISSLKSGYCQNHNGFGAS